MALFAQQMVWLPQRTSLFPRVSLLLFLFGCGRPEPDRKLEQVAVRKQATSLLARDTQRLAKRRGLTWLSNEPLVNWSKTPLTLRLASHQQLQRSEAEQLAKDLLHAILWACNTQQSIRHFANHELGRLETRPIEWDDLAIKISFWSQEGERYAPPAVAQLVVQKGISTTWLSDPESQRLQGPVTRALAPPLLETPIAVDPDPLPASRA